MANDKVVLMEFQGLVYTLPWQDWEDLANCVHDLEGGQRTSVKYGSTMVKIIGGEVKNG